MLYLRTVRYLKPAQIYGRVWHRLARPRVDLRAAPRMRDVRGHWVTPFRREASMLGLHRFVFLNAEHDLAGRGWDDPAIARLWRYQLHYFDDLNAIGAEQRAAWHRDLLLRWVHENPPAIGTGWEPYPTSLRIVNWIKWALAGNALPDECTTSLAVQVRWLTRRLEHHILGNHLYANGKALVFAGLFFEGEEADAWRRKGLEILHLETDEQILADGGHFERSPMYHALMLEDVLDLLNAAGAYDLRAPELDKLRQRVPQMRAWLHALTHPDGEIAFFNDAAFGNAPNAAAIDAYAARLGIDDNLQPATAPLINLAGSGYIRVEHDGAVALLDVAPVSGDYLTAHAHADTLSFELSIGTQRVIVNSGTSQYGQDAERLRQRGTAAHSTVVIDGENSSEVWGGFRVARRARPHGLHVQTDGVTQVRCSHDGYARLPGRPVHTRTWSFERGGILIEDSIRGSFKTAEARFHLHPDVRVMECHAQEAVLQAGTRAVRVRCEGGVLQQVAGTWHPRFGVAQPNQVLVVRFEGDSIRTRVQWSEAA